MDQSTKDMIFFCLEFVRNNLYEQSQNVQCRTWIKTATDLIEKSGLDSSDFMILNLHAIDGYFSGTDSMSTSNHVIEKIKIIESLMANA